MTWKSSRIVWGQLRDTLSILIDKLGGNLSIFLYLMSFQNFADFIRPFIIIIYARTCMIAEEFVLIYAQPCMIAQEFVLIYAQPCMIAQEFVLIYAQPCMIAEDIAKLFPNLYGQPSVQLIPSESGGLPEAKLKIGVVLSGGQAPGGHNVIAGIYGI